MVNANSGGSRIRNFGGVKAGVTAKNGQAVHNKILLGLPARECAAMLEKLEFMVLATHTVLHEAQENIKFAYFPNEGLASVLNVMSDGKSVEVGLLGTDGFVGTPLVAGYKSSPSRVIMQIAGVGVSHYGERAGRGDAGMPATHAGDASVCAGAGAAIATGGGVQPAA
jgi:hypothetical protein